MADDEVPGGTFSADGPDNPKAVEAPKNYEICQLSGFRVHPKDLVKRWDGLWVHRDFYEPRNKQDFVRPLPEKLKGSPRQESKDTFVEQSLILATEDGEDLSIENPPGYVQTEGQNQVSVEDL